MNDQIFFFYYNLAHQSKFFDGVIIFFAQYFPYLVILMAIIFLLFHHEVLSSKTPIQAFIKKWREILLVFFSGILAWFLAYGLKYLFHAGRPSLVLPKVIPLISETDFSFPSGHATFFMALAFAIFFSHKKAGYWFIFFALIIGIARITAGVHFPIDILGGYVLGFAIAFFLKNVYPHT